MRRLIRPDLRPDLSDYLDRMQTAVDSGAPAKATWKNQRRSASMRQVAQVLAKTTGPRERCMYCEDSRGTDIDHFRPQSRYPGHVFSWPNFLWICTACNRSKGNRFPCDLSDNPLLIDPTTEEPWDFLFFDRDTGEITARWRTETGREDPKGLSLLEVISPLRHQAVTEGRRRTASRLKRAVYSFLRQTEGGGEISDELIHDLSDHIEDASDYGISVWFFLRDGQHEEPFSTFKARFPSVWHQITEHLGISTS